MFKILKHACQEQTVVYVKRNVNWMTIIYMKTCDMRHSNVKQCDVRNSKTTKSWFSEKINIQKPLTRLIKKEERNFLLDYDIRTDSRLALQA